MQVQVFYFSISQPQGGSYSSSMTKYRDDLESYYDDEDLTSHLSSHNSNNDISDQQETSHPETEEQRPPLPQRCLLKPNVRYFSYTEIMQIGVFINI